MPALRLPKEAFFTLEWSLFHTVVVFYFLNKTPWKTLPPHLRARKIHAFREGLDYSSYRQVYHESQRHWLWNQSRFRECKEQSLGLTSFTYVYPWIFFTGNFCFLIQIPSIPVPSRMYCHLPWTCINCEVLPSPLWKEDIQITCRMSFAWK